MSKSSPLIECACSGNVSGAQRILDINCSAIDDVDDKGYSAMHWCAYFDDANIARILLRTMPTCVHCKTLRGLTPLHIAAQENSMRFINLIADHSDLIALSEQNIWGETALHCAAANGHLNVVRKLLDMGIDVSIQDSWKRYAIDVARQNGKSAIVDILSPSSDHLSSDLHKSEHSTDCHMQVTPTLMREFMEHVSARKLKCSENYFGECSNEVRVRNIFSELVEKSVVDAIMTPQHSHSDADGIESKVCNEQSSRKAPIVQSFLAKKATALSQKVEYPGDVEAVQNMLLDPDNFNAGGKDMLGYAAIHKFSSWDKVDLLELLLRSPQITTEDVVTTCGPERFSSLHCCVDAGAMKCLAFLLSDSRVDANQKDKQGRTALALAMERGMLKAIEILSVHSEVKGETDSNNGVVP